MYEAVIFALRFYRLFHPSRAVQNKLRFSAKPFAALQTAASMVFSM